MESTLLDLWRVQALALDMLVIIALLISLKFTKGLLANVNSQSELVDRNNAAFGISFGGGILALGVVLTGVSAGDFATSLVDEVLSMAIFGALGLVLVLAGRVLQDKIVLPKVDIHKELSTDNVACALLDVGHMLAIGLVIRAAMLWVPTSDFRIIPVIIVAFILSQLVITLAALYRRHVFKKRNAGHVDCFQTAIGKGAPATATALRYAAFMVGAALMVTAASNLIVFDQSAYWLSVVTWSIVSLISVPVYAALVLIVRRLVLPGVDVAEEVDRENNVGISAVESSIFIAIAAIFSALV
jgi:uncharacterized membrane protein YjfL (UPF0719 family)